MLRYSNAMRWPRSKPPRNNREASKVPMTLKKATDELAKQVKLAKLPMGTLLGGEFTLKKDGTLYAKQPATLRPGVTLEIPFGDKLAVVPSDAWTKLPHNVWALAKLVEGWKHQRQWLKFSWDDILKPFFGVAAAPPGPVQPWWVVFYPNRFSTPPRIEEEWRCAQTQYRELAKKWHPDKGGTDAQMQQLNAAWEEAKAYFGKK